MSAYRSLVDKYKKTKRELGEAESTIKRITGRDPDEIMAAVPGSARRLSSSAAFPGRRTSFSRRKGPNPARKRSRERESSYEEESKSSDEESGESKKPTLASTVVAKRHQKRSRKTAIEEEKNASSTIKSRNRRMFTSLVHTLTKFQEDERKRAEKGSFSKRAEIEKKVEAATEEERERIKREKEHLFLTRREKQTQLRCLEKKIERAESHEVFDANHHHLLNYIITKSKPPIFFMPSSHTSETRKYLEESRAKIQEIIKKRKESLENDLSEIEEWYRKDSTMPVDKENKQPKDESESRDVPETESESLVIEQEDPVQDSNSNHNSNSKSKSDSDSDSDINDDEDSSNTKNLGSLEDQDFEPIYD